MKRIISAAVIFTALCSYATVTADSPDDKATQALEKVNAIDQKSNHHANRPDAT